MRAVVQRQQVDDEASCVESVIQSAVDGEVEVMLCNDWPKRKNHT